MRRVLVTMIIRRWMIDKLGDTQRHSPNTAIWVEPIHQLGFFVPPCQAKTLNWFSFMHPIHHTLKQGCDLKTKYLFNFIIWWTRKPEVKEKQSWLIKHFRGTHVKINSKKTLIKHVLASNNEFGIQNIFGKFTSRISYSLPGLSLFNNVLNSSFVFSNTE